MPALANPKMFMVFQNEKRRYSWTTKVRNKKKDGDIVIYVHT